MLENVYIIDRRSLLKYNPSVNFDLKARTCYLIVSGSHSYGGQTDESDYDLRGWCIPPKEYFHTFDKHFEQSDQNFLYKEYPFMPNLFAYCHKHKFRMPHIDEKIDHCIYDVRKFFRLAAACNPNLIENLYVDDDEVLICNRWAKKVRDNRHLFLSAKAKHTFTGYAVSQLKRINTHRRWIMHPPEEKPERKDFGLPESSVIPADQRMAAEKLITYRVREWLLQDADVLSRTELALFHNKLADFITNILASKDLVADLSDEQKLFDVARLSAMRRLDMTENYIAVMQAEKKFRTRMNEWKQYQHWKETRNPERAKLEAEYGYDCYSDDTEFLTKDGWKLFDNITDKDLLATVFVDRPEIRSCRPHNFTMTKCLQHQNFGVEYCEPLDRIEGTFTGELYNFRAYHVDSLVTPNHRILYRKVECETKNKRTGPWVLEQAATLPSRFDILRTITPRTTRPLDKYFRNLSIPPISYMRIMGWFLSDGTFSFRKNKKGRTLKSIRITQKKGGKLSSAMQLFHNNWHEQINSSIYEYERKPNEFNPNTIIEKILNIRDRKIVRKLYSDCGHKKEKRVPRWVFELTRRMMSTLLKALEMGDGTIRATPAGSKRMIYYTSLKGLADDVQELALMCGFETSIYGPYTYEREDGYICPIYQIHVKGDVPQHRRLRTYNDNIRKIQVKNRRVVCFTVKNGTLITRRNGHIGIHGNCKHGMQLVRLLVTGKELLTEGKVIVKRPDRQFYLDVKEGKWSYERVIGFLEDVDRELAEIYKNKTYVVPHSPDINRLSHLCQEIVEEALEEWD